MKNKITKFAIGSVLLIVLAFAGAFASCEVIASTAGQDISGAAETVWISLTPTKPNFGDDGTGTAKLALAFNKAIAGLTGDLDEASLANFFTFECDYPADFSKKLKATKVIKATNADAVVYTLTVVNIPATGGIARVTITKPGITPTSRPWSLNGQKIPDEDGPALLDFRFVVSAQNPSLDAEAIGSIDQATGKIVLTAPVGTDTGALTPTVTVNPGCTVTPVGAQDFGNPLTYTVTSDGTGDFKDYEVTVYVQTSSSASINSFQFTANKNSPNLSETVTGIITGTSIAVTVPYGTALGALTPSIMHSGASISPESGIAHDFSNSENSPVQYTVTALDETTTADYRVTVTLGAESVYGIVLSGGGSDPLDGNYAFGETVTGYTQRPDALTVSVRNTGDAETGALSVGITGSNFDLNATTLASIGTAFGSNSATFTVQPKAGLGPAAGAPSENYSATITVSGGNITQEKSFTVSFTVKNWVSVPSIAFATGNGQVSYTITASAPAADSYDIYYCLGEQTIVQTVKGGTKITGASLTGTISSLTNEQVYSFIVSAHKQGYEDFDSAIVQGMPYTVFAIGDTGPAGGKIFYVNPNYAADGWRYLEAAPTVFNASDEGKTTWGTYNSNIGTGTHIGSGKQNTANIIAALNPDDWADVDTAAQFCDAYTHNSYTDWFLPSKDELNEMYETKSSIGGFGDAWYWSSSQEGSNDSWMQSLANGQQMHTYKYYGQYMRPIRSF
ncbi:MAG: hypothetical protein LBT01_00725 [Spirochaetaceae bacterium]|jgi:hypothetical protein|nr:hypothetical protein [Spirochaetaceae bacterium]